MVQRACSDFLKLPASISKGDEDPSPGRYIVTGSQQFGLTSSLSQSLAGRVGLLELLPFAVPEVLAAWSSSLDLVDRALWQGWYPPVFDRMLDPELWYSACQSVGTRRRVRGQPQHRQSLDFRA